MTEPWVRFAHKPVNAPVTGSFAEDYGGYLHRGTDLGAYSGSEVRAPASGTVVAPYNDGSYGIAVCLRHDDGWYTLYAHLSHAVARVGQWVHQGDLLGYSGNTGTSTAPHLHWQLCDSYTFPTDISRSRDPMLQIQEEEDALKLTELQTESLLLRIFAGSEFEGVESRTARLERCLRELDACDTKQSVNDTAVSALTLVTDDDGNVIIGTPAHTHVPGAVVPGAGV